MEDVRREWYRPELLHAAIGYAEVSVVITEAELEKPGPRILYVNDAFTRLSGYSRSEVIGETTRILQGPDTDRAVLENLKTELLAGRDFIGRTINYRKDGSPFKIEWIINHLRDADQNTTHYIAIQRDITEATRAKHQLGQFDGELRETEDRLSSTVTQLESAERQLLQHEKFAALGRMAIGVTHDLNNALSPMPNLIALLEQPDLSQSEQKEWIASLRDSVKHASDLVKNLQHFCEPNSAEFVPQNIRLCDLVNEIPNITRSKWETEQRRRGSAIQLLLEIRDDPIVAGNTTELRQVLVNLVLNAVDAMPNGGQITLKLKEAGGHALIEVSDTGPGLSRTMRDHCFEPYFTTKDTGHGLGLSVCHGIMRRHGGSIEADNSPDGGAIFRLTLPLVDDHEAMANWKTKRPVRVLLIDNDRASQESLRTPLEKWGCRVDTAADAESGLVKFRQNSYDLVLTDLWMRPISGAEVARTVKQANPACKVAVVSQDSKHGIMDRLYGEFPFDSIIVKPVNLSELQKVVRHAQ